MPDVPNDNEAPAAPAPTARPLTPTAAIATGEAALLLVESLIHALVARSLLSVAEAVEIVGVAVDVRQELAADRGERPATAAAALALLEAIGTSLAHDLPDASA